MEKEFVEPVAQQDWAFLMIRQKTQKYQHAWSAYFPRTTQHHAVYYCSVRNEVLF
jgi:hypothetical protein